MQKNAIQSSINQKFFRGNMTPDPPISLEILPLNTYQSKFSTLKDCHFLNSKNAENNDDRNIIG